MPNRNNFKKINFKYEDVPLKMFRRQERIARTVYKPRFERLVEPFTSDIEFDTESDLKNFTTRIGPLDTGGSINAANKRVTGKQIYDFLDEGTAPGPLIILPDDFANETFSNSLRTLRANYDRSRIYINMNETGKGTTARNFSQLAEEELRNVYRQRMENELRKSISQIV